VSPEESIDEIYRVLQRI